MTSSSAPQSAGIRAPWTRAGTSLQECSLKISILIDICYFSVPTQHAIVESLNLSAHLLWTRRSPGRRGTWTWPARLETGHPSALSSAELSNSYSSIIDATKLVMKSVARKGGRSLWCMQFCFSGTPNMFYKGRLKIRIVNWPNVPNILRRYSKWPLINQSLKTFGC